MKGFKVLQFKDISSQLESLHEHGWDCGKYVGFPSFEKHYNMLDDGCTDWTGYPSSGKTELLLELLFNMTSYYGWKHLLYVPDIGKSIEVMAKLIHKHTGNTFIKKYKNYIGLNQAYESAAWVMENFKIIHKTDARAQMTPVELWIYAGQLRAEGIINSVVIDSWKDMRHDYAAHGGSYAQYLSNVLPIRNEIAESAKIHCHTIIHPKNPVLSSKDRKVYAPGTYDMEGGAQWHNSGKCIIAVHRENFDTNVTDIYFRKIKPESVGKNISTPICLEFDVAKSRYFYLGIDGNRYYASEKGNDVAVENIQTRLVVPTEIERSNYEF